MRKALNKEYKLWVFFGILILIIILRLFFLQIIEASYYKKLLFLQHYKMYSLQPQRWNIYIENQSWNKIALTQDVTLSNLFVDPKFIPDKKKFIDIITPYIYKHLCENHWIEKVETKKECIKNIEKYTWKEILPKQDKLFYISWAVNDIVLQTKLYEKEEKEIIEKFNTWLAYRLIKEKLNSIIKTGYRQLNYLGFYSDNALLEELKKLYFISIVDNYYVYVDPRKVRDFKKAKKSLKKIFDKYWYFVDDAKIDFALHLQPIRYIVIAKNVFPEYVRELKKLKEEYYSKKINWIPILHWLGFEKVFKRYYPLWEFLANVLGYVDEKWDWHYGIEEYFNDLLKWKPWKVYGLSAHWIAFITKRWLKVQPAQDWADIYLTIDFDLQKKLEQLLKYRYVNLKADSIAAIVMDPNTWKIKAMANRPTFNPNFYKKVYKIRPLTYKDRYLIDDDTYIDIPILIETGWKLKVANFEERKDLNLKKFIFLNLLGPQVFVDKNISMPYEPWSVFKTFTLAIWIDSDSIDLYDFYEDKWWIKIWPYKIKNVAKECKWIHTFLHALEWSCNVWMVKIAEKIKRYVFYNYLDRLGFGKKTGIQLAWEDPGDIPALRNFSLARFFNNTFWQGILVTPLQLAVWYSAMVNWWYLIKPTIVEKIYYPNTKQWIYYKPQILGRIFSSKTSEDIKLALYKVIYEWDLPMLAISGFTLWGKTWTSQIAFKGKYQQWAWWTNGSFVWIVTKNNLKYVIAIQVRRPRTCQWWVCSAWKIFKDIAQYLIERDWIQN